MAQAELPQTAEEALEQALKLEWKRVPWYLWSFLAHAILGGVMWYFSKDPAPPPVKLQAQVAVDSSAPPALTEEKELPPEVPELKDQKAVNDPILDEQLPAEHDEDDTNSEYEETFGSEGAISDVVAGGQSNSDVVGLGAGAAGSPGDRRGGREKMRRGRGEKTQKAVDLALKWLSDHQSPDGRWDADGFTCDSKFRRPCACQEKAIGGNLYDVGLTGLAILCFLGAGETHKTGEYKNTVSRGLLWLRDQQDAEGCFGTRACQRFTYNHALATLAMCEAWWLTRAGLFQTNAQKGLDFCAASQSPTGGWRYSVRSPDADSSITGWMLMALKSGKVGGLTVSQPSITSALAYLETLTDPAGRLGYQRRGDTPVREGPRGQSFPARESESLTSVGMFSRIMFGEDPAKSPVLQKGSQLLQAKLPVWDKNGGKIDMYYWYYGTLSMFQIGGTQWELWNHAMESAIIASQNLEPPLRGSWDPVDPWGEEGGRVYSTAILCLCLEVYYRYDRVFGTSK